MSPFPPDPMFGVKLSIQPTPAEVAAHERLSVSRCPQCGHPAYEHVDFVSWHNHSTCKKCLNEPGAFDPRYDLCFLTITQVRQAVALGSPECLNADDPVLCKYDPELGRIVPEAGCPLHDIALNGSAA